MCLPASWANKLSLSLSLSLSTFYNACLFSVFNAALCPLPVAVAVAKELCACIKHKAISDKVRLLREYE